MSESSQRQSIQIQQDLSISSIWTRPASEPVTAAVILAHGAGAGMDHEFMVQMHEGLASRGIACVRFNFPYVERGRKAPDRSPLLEKTLRTVTAAVRDRWRPDDLFIGGKSMGGRMASHLAAQGEPVTGLFLLGYPLHPPGKLDRLRREHLTDIRCPTLFIQGSRDNLCKLDLLRPELEKMPAAVKLVVIEGGNHSFQVPARLKKSKTDIRRQILDTLAEWIQDQQTECRKS